MKLAVPGAAAPHLLHEHPSRRDAGPRCCANLETHVVAVKAPRRAGPALRRRPAALGRGRGGAGRARRARRVPRLPRGAAASTSSRSTAFPTAPFHGRRVKEEVYRPDWLERRAPRLHRPPRRPARRSSCPTGRSRAASARCPALQAGAPARPTPSGAWPRTCCRHAATLQRLRERTAGRIVAGARARALLRARDHRATPSRSSSGTCSRARRCAAFVDAHAARAPATARTALRRHLGVCLDACHAAVEFEDAARRVAALARAGIRIAKLQVSAGLLRPAARTPTRWRRCAPFAEGVYLHQVVVERGARPDARYLDLPEALAGRRRRRRASDEWRVHFHVPAVPASRSARFAAPRPSCGAPGRCSAAGARSPRTSRSRPTPGTSCPRSTAREPVDDAIARELRWTLDQLESP